MHDTAPATDAALEPQPFAHCRFCGGEIGRAEQVAVWRRSGKVAHLKCYDAYWLTFELADQIGGVA
jgi:hypothetical protein